MNRTLLSALIAAAAVAAVCMLAITWALQVWLERTLTLGEWVMAVLVGVVVIGMYMQGWRARSRRKLEDMRDSALW